MKSIVIANQNDTVVGLRLAGIEGILVKDDTEVMSHVEELIKDDSIGTIMITQELFEKNHDAIFEIKMKLKEKTIIKIPGFNEKMQESLISEHIRDSVGLKL